MSPPTDYSTFFAFIYKNNFKKQEAHFSEFKSTAETAWKNYLRARTKLKKKDFGYSVPYRNELISF